MVANAPDVSNAVDGENETAYWVAVSRVPHIGPVRIQRLIQCFGSLETAWSAPSDKLRAALEPRPLTELLNARAKSDPVREHERLQAQGIEAVYPGHPTYPRLLAEISGRPSVLYVRGQLTASDESAVAIVGTRRATAYGRQAAERVAAELARAGVTVISGMARGIDAVAHRAALDAGGRTIAVLGSGPDVIYPPEHRGLSEQIIGSGAVISELAPGSKPDAQNFPARNRIISGLSLGVVVVEAPMRSGTLITASFAGDQGREVFVIPGSVFSQASEGANALIRDGARLVRDGNDVLEDLNLSTHQASDARQQHMPLDEGEQRILAAVKPDARHIDEIAEDAGFVAAAASHLLLTLELKGIVRNHGAQYYALR